MSQDGRLTAGEERDLVVAAEAGDRDASARLVETFLPRITALAHHFPAGGGVGRSELVQEGVAGLLFATRRYDQDLGTPFWAYATFWVRKAMQEFVAEITRPVALSDRAVRALAAVRAARVEYRQAHGTEATTAEVIRATGLTRAQIESLEAVQLRPRSVEEPVDGGGGSSDTVGDRIPDPVAEQAYDVVLDRIELRRVSDLTDHLSERERVVLRSHYGLGEPAQTLARIGAALGVTAERVRQIEAGALAKLRAALAGPVPVPAGGRDPGPGRLTGAREASLLSRTGARSGTREP